jgi:HAD superfamily hydrolase (TIGR01509 family)
MSSIAIQGLVVDWGGVVTQPLREGLAVWAEQEDLDPAGIMQSLTELIIGENNQLHALERGELTRADIEPWLADVFSSHGPRPEPAGLFDRMFAPLRTNRELLNLIRTQRESGLRTGLLSNSWGDSYDRTDWELVFDAVVISGEVGMRKPEERIFTHVLELIDLPAPAVVYVDDEYPNVEAAASYGLRAVHYDPTDPDRFTRITAALHDISP